MYKTITALSFLFLSTQVAQASEVQCPNGVEPVNVSLFAGKHLGNLMFAYAEESGIAARNCITFADLKGNESATPDTMADRFLRGDIDIATTIFTAASVNRRSLQIEGDFRAVVVGAILPSYGHTLRAKKYLPDENGGTKLYTGPLDLLGQKIAVNQCPEEQFQKSSGEFAGGTKTRFPKAYAAGAADLLYRSQVLSEVKNFRVLCGEPDDFDPALAKTSVFLVPRGYSGSRDQAFWSGEVFGSAFVEPAMVMNLEKGETVDLFLNDTDLDDRDFAMAAFFNSVLVVRADDLENPEFKARLDRVLATVEETMVLFHDPEFTEELVSSFMEFGKGSGRGPIRDLVKSDYPERYSREAAARFKALLPTSTCLDVSLLKEYALLVGLTEGEFDRLYDHNRTCE